ncbi:MAG: Golgi-to-ER vesicle coat component [Chaenotheca gracillima]|nr:MAG: Golgi-to-ER vesicle coat component [Chaenotheca gracillima]
MARTKLRKPGKKPGNVTAKAQQPTPPKQDEVDAEMASDGESDDPMEKDATELELERRIFGDEAGFREGLRSHTRAGDGLESSSDVELEDGELDKGPSKDVGEGVAGLDDADLFFLDSGPTTTDGQALVSTSYSDEEDSRLHKSQAAWEDSEDERLQVSLASDTRLRKLRVNEAEDIVDGREYSKRLRRQYERLNPLPEWAVQSTSSTSPKKKKRRKSSFHDATSSQSGSDSEEDSDNFAASQPLAKFLQNPSALTSSSTTGSRLRLRSEVLDVQRIPDLPGAQPSAINSLEFHPQYPSLLLTSGPSSLISIFHLTSIPSPTLLTSLHLRSSSSLSTASFHRPDGLSVYLSTLQKRHFHVWDLRSGGATKVSRVYGHREEQRNMARFKLSPCGRFLALLSSTGRGGSASEGSVNILDARTTQWITQAQLESPSSGGGGAGGIADFCWWRDGDGLSIALKSGEIGEFHIPSRRFLARWTGDGVTGCTTIALGGDRGPPNWGGDHYLAIGSTSGMVDIYDRKAVFKGVSQASDSANPPRPQPLRSIGQLTTPTSNLEFSPDGQELANQRNTSWQSD